MITRRGLMLVLSSPSGAGKTSIARSLLTRDKEIYMSVSATTRPRRPGEAEGKDDVRSEAEAGSYRKVVCHTATIQRVVPTTPPQTTPPLTLTSSPDLMVSRALSLPSVRAESLVVVESAAEFEREEAAERPLDLELERPLSLPAVTSSKEVPAGYCLPVT